MFIFRSCLLNERRRFRRTGEIACTRLVSKESGFSVLAAVVMAIVLAAALTYVLIGNDVPTQAVVRQNVAAELVAQAQFVRQQVLRCVTDFPSGNNGTIYHPVYPESTITGTSVAISGVTCPGSGTSLFGAADGAFLPASPNSSFQAWMYRNSSAAVTISITTTDGATWGPAITAAAAMFGAGEASTSGSPASTLTITIVQ